MSHGKARSKLSYVGQVLKTKVKGWEKSFERLKSKDVDVLANFET